MTHRREQDERPPLPGAGYLEDYTTPFLFAAGALIFVALFTLWATFGLSITVIAALLADRLLLRRGP